MIKGSFEFTSFKLSEDNSPNILQALEKYRDTEDSNVIYNQKHLLFLEDRYIEECKKFTRVAEKLSIKKFDDKLYIFKENKMEKLVDYSQEVKMYDQVISENNINNISKENLTISVKHFTEYKQSKKILFIQYIYILLFLSNSTDYNENDFLFKVNIDDKEVKKEVSFTKEIFSDLVKVYLWVIQSKENLQTRLKIIRKIIVMKNSFDLTEKDLHSAKSSFNRIINDETEKYFEQVNMLKGDFLKLNEQRQRAYQSLHLKFLSWGGSIALFIYGEAKNLSNDNVWNSLLFSSNEKIKLFLIIFITSLIIIYLIFKKEIRENHNEFSKIKQLYLEKLFFDANDEETLKLDAPKVSKMYRVIFYIVLTILIIRLAITFI